MSATKSLSERSPVVRERHVCDTCDELFYLEIDEVRVRDVFVIRVVHHDRARRSPFKSEVELTAEVLSGDVDGSWMVLRASLLRCAQQVAERTRCLEYEFKPVGYATGGIISAGSISARHITAGSITGSGGAGGTGTIIGSGGIVVTGAGGVGGGAISTSGSVHVGALRSEMSDFYDQLLQNGCTERRSRR